MPVGIYNPRPDVGLRAIQFKDDAERLTEISAFVNDTIRVSYNDPANPILKVFVGGGPGPGQTIYLRPGDWLLRGSANELFKLTNDTFTQIFYIDDPTEQVITA